MKESWYGKKKGPNAEAGCVPTNCNQNLRSNRSWSASRHRSSFPVPLMSFGQFPTALERMPGRQQDAVAQQVMPK